MQEHRTALDRVEARLAALRQASLRAHPRRVAEADAYQVALEIVRRERAAQLDRLAHDIGIARL